MSHPKRKNYSSDSATVICDASFCMETKSAGWAAWLRMGEAKLPFKKSMRFKADPKTSQQAELWACVNSIKIALDQGANDIFVQNDCKVAVAKINDGCPELNMILKQIKRDVTIRAKWVPGHTKGNTPRTWVNNWCDAAAKRIMRKQRDNYYLERKKKNHEQARENI